MIWRQKRLKGKARLVTDFRLTLNFLTSNYKFQALNFSKKLAMLIWRQGMTGKASQGKAGHRLSTDGSISDITFKLCLSDWK